MCGQRKKKEPSTHCLRMLSSPKISRNFGNFRKICSVTLTSTRHTDFSWVKEPGTDHSVWTMMKER